MIDKPVKLKRSTFPGNPPGGNPDALITQPVRLCGTSGLAHTERQGIAEHCRLQSSQPCACSQLSRFPQRGHPERLWSSTTFAADSTYAWSVDFAAGDVDTSPKTDAEIVRAVRGP